MYNIIRNIKGFTLAEILVTLGVIGVIASMTVPTLVQDVQEAQFKAAWKKTFADFSQASKRLATDKAGNLSNVFNGSGNQHDRLKEAFLPYLNYTKLCAAGSATGTNGCWHTTFYKLSGQLYSGDWSSMSRLILNNGVLVAFYLDSLTCIDTRTPNNDSCGKIFVDINGYRGPNVIGKDIYGGHLVKAGNLIPRGTQGDICYNDPNSSCDTDNGNTIG
jgi:prepilin-type N-terminal cleavage/methylation domain-containing protein